ncbi:MAG: hypothetical protein CL610_03220 [Anaerolineaceae bacterium]|nr:hypothetical protein [Anaerolineaceae bacterium]
MVIRVLIINRQLVFAVTIKQALEQTGAFEAHPFTDPNAAAEYLRTHPHDVALVDFAIKVMPGPRIVELLREIQPEIAIIVSPMQDDSNRVLRDLNLQGMVDAPFSARGIIPLIEHAIEQVSSPTRAVTRSFFEPDEHTGMDTEVLGRTEPNEIPPQVSRHEPAQTRLLDDEDEISPNRPDTRTLPNRPENLSQTRDLHENLPQTRDLSGHVPDEPAQTRILDEDDESGFAPPPYLPEFSSLDDVLADEAPSTLFEPPPRDGDTPAVPNVDSDAIRQFLATSPEAGERLFDRMLGQIEPETGDKPALPEGSSASDFDSLVNSMRSEKPHTPLPDRHQQFVEFILTGGMDSLLSEIEKSKTGLLGEDGEEEDEADPPELPPPPPSLPPTTFEKLAAEEPPLPGLEEGGTVSDLMVGVSDTSFRNVLAMMRGEDYAEGDDVESSMPSRQEIEDAYAAFFDQEVAGEAEEEAAPPPAKPKPPTAPLPRLQPIEEDDDEPSITAQLILETALDESTPADSFSLDDLIGNIERQLAEHQPKIQPLPSWNVNSLQPKKPPQQDQSQKPPKSRIDRYIQEPDFLPESLPEEEQLEDTPEEAPDQVWEMMRKAQEQRASLEQALAEQQPEPPVVDDEPAFDIAAWDEPTQVVEREPEDVAEAPEIPEEAPPTYEEPPSLPDEPADEATVVGQRAALPADLWDNMSDEWSSDADWDSAPEAEPEVEEIAAEVEEPSSLPGFEDDWELAVDEAPEDQTVMMDRSRTTDELVALGAAADFDPQYSEFDIADPDDPYIAQIALSLTQVSLELAAEATLLTSNDEIMAFAGQLEQSDVEELRAVLADDWDANANEARIRFVTAPTSGKDYMLYSRKTVNDFTLTMIFSGTTPLRDIRRQGRRLIDALESVDEVAIEALPEPMPTPAAATMTAEMPAVAPVEVEDDEPETTQPFTYLWMLRDPDAIFEDFTARAIVAGLRLQLTEQDWHIQSLAAQGEYVYVHADVPGERPAYEVIDDLKQRTAEIIHAQYPDINPDELWADSYLVMMPGRELDADEISQFINFERMA